MSQKVRKGKNKSAFIRFLDLFLNISFFAMISGFLALFYFINTAPSNDIEAMIRPNNSVVYDVKGKEIGVISRKAENQKNIEYRDLSNTVINTLLGTEDAKYYIHRGVDVLSTIQGGFNMLLKRSANVAGGSTITQQLVRRTQLNTDPTVYEPFFDKISRKIYEVILSVQVDSVVSKNELIQLYLNYFEFGHNNIHGIEVASNFFYSLKAYELDYIQASTIVGTLNSPGRYNPLGIFIESGYINKSQERLQLVLLSNKNQGYISDDEYRLLSQVKVPMTLKLSKVEGPNPYQPYIDVVKTEMEKEYGIDFSEGTYHIHTAMDKEQQLLANGVGDSSVLPLPDPDMDYGFILSKSKTGEITAVGGGKTYQSGKQYLFNNGVDLLQHPGSSFKPIIDYSPTFEFLHWGDRSPISNEPYVYPGTNISVRNADGTSGGIYTMDAAIRASKNLTALRALEAVVEEVGFEGVNKYLSALGFNFKTEDLGYSAGLGALYVSPRDMVGAYQTFANGGYYIKPHTVIYYEDEQGHKTNTKFKPKQAIDERTAFMTSTSLERSTQGSALLEPANYYSSPYAAKTGTSDWGDLGLQYGIPLYSARDSWMAGYTTEYTLAVWSGFDGVGIEKGKYPQWGAQHNYASTIWGYIMNNVATGDEKSYLAMTPPGGIEQAYFDINTPAPFKEAGLYRIADKGYFYSDNLPSGKTEPAINIDVLNVEVSFTSANQISFDFAKPEGDLASQVKMFIHLADREIEVGHGITLLNPNDYDTYKAYYKYKDTIYGEVTGCYYDKQLFAVCPIVEEIVPPEN